VRHSIHPQQQQPGMFLKQTSAPGVKEEEEKKKMLH
jgi:hypothetical protein